MAVLKPNLEQIHRELLARDGDAGAMTPYRAYIFKGISAKHRDFPTEAEAVAAVAQIREEYDGWDGWTEPAPDEGQPSLPWPPAELPEQIADEQ